MKCLSVRQPGANLIVTGEKTIEVRGQPTSHRGELLIHAPLEIEKGMERLAPEFLLPRGAIVGVVWLRSVVQFNTRRWRELRDRHKTSGPMSYGERTFGWELSYAYMLREPIPAKGRLGMFEAPDEIALRICVEMPANFAYLTVRG